MQLRCSAGVMISGDPSGSLIGGGFRIRLDDDDCSRASASICSARTAAIAPVRFSSAILYAAALALDADPEPIGGPGGGGGNLGAACIIGGGFPTADDLGEALGGV